MPYTDQELPWTGSTPRSRHASYRGAESAAPRAGSQVWRLWMLYQTCGPQTDHEAAQALGLPLATICARRNSLVSKGLVEAGELVPGPYRTVNTRWQLSGTV
jgi:hypothetical protein